VCTGVDCTITSLYETLAKQAKGEEGENAYIKMHYARTDSFKFPRTVPRSFPWEETGQTLAQAVAAPKQQPFQFTLDKKTPQKFSSTYWGSTQLPPHDGNLEFMRKVVEPAKTLSETQIDRNTMMTLMIMQQQQQAAAAYEQQALLNIKFMEEEGFKLTYSADSIHMIPVKPSANWYNETFVQSQKTSALLQPKTGKMALLPVAFYVATRPKVVFQVAEQHVAGLKKVYESNGEFSIIIGGNHFKSIQTTPLSDSVPFENDTLTVEEITNEEAAATTEEQDVEMLADAIAEAIVEEDEESVESDSKFSWLQAALIAQSIQRAQQAAAHAKAQLQKLFRVTIQSNSDIPQVIGVVSKVLSK